ncbi:MAG: TRAP transporter small permease subunit [Treponema sp.]|nr:TRAP transporter small permease subunit [Treponema sp.]
MKKFFDVYRTIVISFCKICLAMQVIIVVFVVFGRRILNWTPGWGETSALLFMVWFSLMSASMCILEDRHLRITLTDLFLPPVVIKIFDIVSLIVIFLFSLFMIIYGYQMAKLSGLNILAGMGIKSTWLFGAVPVSGLALFLASIEKGIMVWKKK